MEGLPPYMPHLSLLYSDIPMADRDQVGGCGQKGNGDLVGGGLGVKSGLKRW